jgi:hypothetical protein
LTDQNQYAAWLDRCGLDCPAGDNFRKFLMACFTCGRISTIKGFQFRHDRRPLGFAEGLGKCGFFLDPHALNLVGGRTVEKVRGLEISDLRHKNNPVR